MKRNGILNAELVCELTKIRHMDSVMICDMGFPIPDGANWVDVSFVEGIPSLAVVLEALLREMIFEHYTIDECMKEANPQAYQYVTGLLQKLPHDEVPFVGIQSAAEGCKLCIRTGESGRRCNVILRSASGVRASNERFDILP